MRVHWDMRRTAYCDVFELPDADVNVFILNPGQKSGWHRHTKQRDQFFVPPNCGALKVGMWRDGEDPSYHMVWNGHTMVVEPGTWHGYENVSHKPAVIVMHLSHKYEDGWDEEQKSFDEVPWFWGREK